MICTLRLCEPELTRPSAAASAASGAIHGPLGEVRQVLCQVTILTLLQYRKARLSEEGGRWSCGRSHFLPLVPSRRRSSRSLSRTPVPKVQKKSPPPRCPLHAVALRSTDGRRCLCGCCLRLAHAFMCCTSSWAGAAPQVIALRRDLAAALAEISSLKKQLELANRKAAQAR